MRTPLCTRYVAFYAKIEHAPHLYEIRKHIYIYTVENITVYLSQWQRLGAAPVVWSPKKNTKNRKELWSSMTVIKSNEFECVFVWDDDYMLLSAHLVQNLWDTCRLSLSSTSFWRVTHIICWVNNI